MTHPAINPEPSPAFEQLLVIAENQGTTHFELCDAIMAVVYEDCEYHDYF